MLLLANDFLILIIYPLSLLSIYPLSFLLLEFVSHLSLSIYPLSFLLLELQVISNWLIFHLLHLEMMLKLEIEIVDNQVEVVQVQSSGQDFQYWPYMGGAGGMIRLLGWRNNSMHYNQLEEDNEHAARVQWHFVASQDIAQQPAQNWVVVQEVEACPDYDWQHGDDCVWWEMSFGVD
ncbi:hypothetical protein DFH29DRAFT_883821 [Suillus ampliporus]|nr:hypothetical protein DFH29DRAFT_883821 [Suillus ampliporus]